MKLIDEEKNSNNLMCGLQYPHPTYSFSQQIIDEWKMIENRHKKWSQRALAIWSPHKQGYLASNKLFFSSKLKKNLQISKVPLLWKLQQSPFQKPRKIPSKMSSQGPFYRVKKERDLDTCLHLTLNSKQSKPT